MYGIQVIIPNQKDREIINRIIFNELIQGQIKDTSRETYKRIIWSLEQQGAEGVILGCIEILIKQTKCKHPYILIPQKFMQKTA